MASTVALFGAPPEASRKGQRRRRLKGKSRVHFWTWDVDDGDVTPFGNVGS